MDISSRDATYQVGDVVEIRNNIRNGNLDPAANILFVDDMLPYRGEIATITAINWREPNGYYYRLDVDKGRRMWGESWLIPAPTAKVDIEESAFACLL